MTDLLTLIVGVAALVLYFTRLRKKKGDPDDLGEVSKPRERTWPFDRKE